MAQQLSPETLATVFSSIFVLAVGGGLAYLYVVAAAVPAQPPVVHNYNAVAIEAELKQSDDTNVFLKTVTLQQPVVQQQSTVKYTQQDLGKSNLGQLGQ